MSILDAVTRAGLGGRGGAGFPTAVKIRAGWEAGADLLVNVCDGERGAAKDAWVVAHHLADVVAGARLVAGERAAGARYAAHRGTRTEALLRAAGLPVLPVPRRYVSSEESALVSLAHGGLGRPLDTPEPIVRGARSASGRRLPATLVLNAETLWRVAQIDRFGPDWFRGFGTPDDPGPRLVSVGGHVRAPNVVESAAGARVGDLVDAAGGADAEARVVLVGGLAGVFLTLEEARTTVWSSPGMARHGGGLGPGVVEVLDPRRRFVDVVGGLLAHAASETAGQCGPCMFGLPAVAEAWARLADTGEPTALPPLTRLLHEIPGRGACHHPDGAVRLARSALRILGSGPEPPMGAGPLSGRVAGPLPAPEASIRIDRTRCSGHGICAQTLPGRIRLDPQGYPIVDSVHVGATEGQLAVRLCPARALQLQEPRG